MPLDAVHMGFPSLSLSSIRSARWTLVVLTFFVLITFVLCRAGRMGRELAMSLTSVVLDAIATVREQKQDALESRSGGAQRQDQSHQRYHEGRNETRHLSLKRGSIVATPRGNLERVTRRQGEGSQRPDGPPRHIKDPESRLRPRTRSAASARKGGHRQILVKDGVEDPGLADLDEREREFRRVRRGEGMMEDCRRLVGVDGDIGRDVT